jgi:O-antigen/teichoic acid export membrane protein
VASFSILVASDAAFGVVFGVFVLALAVLAVIAVRWGVRRDRPGREAWRQRRVDAIEAERRRSGDGEGPRIGR